EILVVDFDGHRFLARAVQDSGNSRLAAQAAARTRALNAPRFGFDLDLHLHSRLNAGPATRRTAVFDCSNYSTNNELTELSSQILRTVSAMRPATLTTRILSHASASGLRGMVSVTTTSSIAEAVMRATAGPDNTGCVQYATTRTAPCSFN